MNEEKKIWEVVYIYDVKEANPNGDPMMENRPRFDDLVGTPLVSDVRLKRWIRDYFISKGEYVFVREERGKDGKLLSREEIIKNDLGENLDINKIKDKYIDIRLFGATLSIKGRKDERSLIGPVQFRIARSLNKTDVIMYQGTTMFPSGKKRGQQTEAKRQGTMTQWWGVRYAIFPFYGVINFNNEDTGLKKEDVEKLFEALVNLFSVKTATTRSKTGHRIVGIILVKTPTYIGNLDTLIRLKKEGKDITYDCDEENVGKKLTGTEKLDIDISNLVEVANKAGAEVVVWKNPNHKQINFTGINNDIVKSNWKDLLGE